MNLNILAVDDEELALKSIIDELKIVFPFANIYSETNAEDAMIKAKELQKSGARTSVDLSRLIAEEISAAEGRKKSLENHERYDPYNKGKPKGYSLDDDDEK